MKEDEISKAFQMAKTSLEIEGQKLPEGGEELILANARGDISDEEFFKRALEIAMNVKNSGVVVGAAYDFLFEKENDVYDIEFADYIDEPLE